MKLAIDVNIKGDFLIFLLFKKLKLSHFWDLFFKKFNQFKNYNLTEL